MTKTTSFDEAAAEYDAWFDKHRDLHLAELEAVRSFIPVSGSGMEIGVGTGRFAAPLGIPTGVEPSHRMAELARLRGVHVLDGLAEALPFADESFDFVVMVTVVCFLSDVAQSFSEACRILNPNGTLVIGFINRESELGQYRSREKLQSRFFRDATFYSAGELEELLTKAGFSDFAYRQTLSPGEIPDLSVQEGHDRGGFVVMRAQKRAKGGHT